MARRVIDTFWDRKTRNDINDNFEELYEGVNATRTSINDLVLESGKSDMEVVQARGGKKVLNDRLNDIEQSKRDKNQEIQMSDLSQEVKEGMTGGSVAVVGKDSVGKINVKDKAISYEKTDFVITGKNLFNGTFTSEFTYFSAGTINRPQTTTPKAALIKIDHNTTYSVTKFEGGNRFILCLLEFIPEESDLPIQSPAIHDGNRDGNKESYTFTSGPNSNYLFILTNSDGGNVPLLQVEKGSSPSEYESFKVGFKSPLNEIPLKMSKGNIFDGEYIDGVFFNNSNDNPTIVPVYNYGNITGKVAICELDNNASYSIKIYEPEKSNRFRVALSKEKPIFQERESDLQTGGVEVPSHYWRFDKVLEINSNATEVSFNSEEYNFVGVYVDGEGNEPIMWVGKGSYPSEYIGKKVIDPSYIEFPPNFSDTEYPDQAAKDRFVVEMNRYAERIGMEDTNYVEPAGYPSTAEQTMTAYDILLMGIQAVSYDKLARIWNKKTYDVEVRGPDARTQTINTTVTNSSLESDYYIFGGKTGRIVSVEPSENLLLIANAPNDRMFVGAVMGAESSDKRFTAMKQMYDYSKEILDGNTPSDLTVDADHGATCLLPISHLSSFERYDIPIIFSKDMKTKRHPASVSKVMSAMVILDNIVNLNEKITIKSSDIKGGTGNVFSEGDVITVEDALYAMMLPSSNTATHAAARYVGNKLLNIDNK